MDSDADLKEGRSKNPTPINGEENRSQNPTPINSDSDSDGDMRLRSLIERYRIVVLSSRLKGDPKLVENFGNILKSLEIEDADWFSDMVKQVLENKDFIKELYDECEDGFIFGTIKLFGDDTQGRVETIGERMTRIKNDRYFRHTWVGGDDELVVRAGMSILLCYCTTADDVSRMGLLDWMGKYDLPYNRKFRGWG